MLNKDKLKLDTTESIPENYTGVVERHHNSTCIGFWLQCYIEGGLICESFYDYHLEKITSTEWYVEE